MTADNQNSKHLTKKKLQQKQIREKRGWYLITLVRDLPDLPYRFTLFGEPFVLFRDRDGKLVCYSSPSLSKPKDNKAKSAYFQVVVYRGGIWFWRAERRL